MALYALFYLSFFALLERTIQTPDLWVHCQLDDLIPFCKYAIVPYILWFPWIPFTLFYLLYKAPREDFWRLCIPLFTGMTMTLLFVVFCKITLRILARSLCRIKRDSNLFVGIIIQGSQFF